MTDNQELDPYGFTVRLHEQLRIPVKTKATLQGKSIKTWVEEAVAKALSDKCCCEADRSQTDLIAS